MGGRSEEGGKREGGGSVNVASTCTCIYIPWPSSPSPSYLRRDGSTPDSSSPAVSGDTHTVQERGQSTATIPPNASLCDTNLHLVVLVTGLCGPKVMEYGHSVYFSPTVCSSVLGQKRVSRLAQDILIPG